MPIRAIGGPLPYTEINVIMHENGIRPTAISHHGTKASRIKTGHTHAV